MNLDPLALVRRIAQLERRLDALRLPEAALPTWRSTMHSSVDWTGNAFSTTAKTLLDLSSVFNMPANIKAALASIRIRDSASAANDCFLILSPNDTANRGIRVSCEGVANDGWAAGGFWVPCTADGDIYYQIAASGASTMDIYLHFWGYWK